MKKLFLFLFFFNSVLWSGVGGEVNAQFTKLHDFKGGANGGRPGICSPISDGTYLYGMTTQGGVYDKGIIFKMLHDGSDYTILLDFAGASNGRAPSGALVFDGTFLYGMTTQGGVNDLGTIFKIKPDGTGYVKLLDFAGQPDGSHPYGSLISDGTYLYGMTSDGGYNTCGEIFKIKEDGTGYTSLLDFNGFNGRSPWFGSLLSDGSFLYGMTMQGGVNDMGVIFKIKSDGTGFVKLLDFAGLSNGSYTTGSLISDGTFLYGTTFAGGIGDYGTIFKIMSDGTGYAIVLNFTAYTNEPRDLVFDGTFLYGETEDNGGPEKLFRIMPDGSSYFELYNFSYTDGNNPCCTLVYDGTGLYGMTVWGGDYNDGTIFKYQDIGMGVIENNSEINFNIYPNPSSGNISVEVDLAKDEHANLKVMNALGQIIVQQERELINGNNKFNLDLSSLTKGIYFIQIQTSSGVVTKKITLN